MPDTDEPCRPWDEDDADGNDESCFSGEYSALEAFEAFLPPSEGDDTSWPMAAIGDGDNCIPTITFTATNPLQTVIVTALMDGRILHIDLAPQVTAMSETELAKEIMLVAEMARMQAQAAQHAVIAAMMNRTGLDPAATRNFIERDLHLPSPEAVKAHRTQFFAERHIAGEQF